MTKQTPMSVRISSNLSARVSKLAEAMDRPKSWIIERAIEDYVSLQAWQVAEIKRGLQEADAGDFATDDEVEAVFRKWMNAGRLASKRRSKSR
jgi:RHH-type transcriptional regulator, rel operon repressor / antitoxin RelB